VAAMGAAVSWCTRCGSTLIVDADGRCPRCHAPPADQPEKPRMMRGRWPKRVGEDTVALEDVAPPPVDDGWRLDEWNALPDVCFIATCENTEIDERGPIWLRDGSMHKACVEHWEPIMRVLGEQATWEKDAGVLS
jgi:hypothetical protein